MGGLQPSLCQPVNPPTWDTSAPPVIAVTLLDTVPSALCKLHLRLEGATLVGSGSGGPFLRAGR